MGHKDQLLILLVESLVEIPDEINFSQEIDASTPGIETVKTIDSNCIDVSCKCDYCDETDEDHQESLYTRFHVAFIHFIHNNRDYFVLEPVEGVEPTT